MTRPCNTFFTFQPVSCRFNICCWVWYHCLVKASLRPQTHFRQFHQSGRSQETLVGVAKCGDEWVGFRQDEGSPVANLLTFSLYLATFQTLWAIFVSHKANSNNFAALKIFYWRLSCCASQFAHKSQVEYWENNFFNARYSNSCLATVGVFLSEMVLLSNVAELK